MLNFEFQNPTKVLFGKGQIARIAQEIPSDARILIVYGGGSVLKNGTMDQVKAALPNRTIFEFGGVQPNPDYETLMQAIELVQTERINYLLAVGGGSVIDGTKFISAGANWELGEPWEILINQGKGIRNPIPFGCVLTLPATGSEMNQHAVISRKIRQVVLPSAGGLQGNSGAVSMQSTVENEKLGFSSEQVFPQFAVLDPSVTMSLPKIQVANGVVDSFCHVMEQYLTYPVHASLQDRFAESILLTLLTDGMKSFQEPDDYEARANLMWCATMALNGIIGSGVPQDWSTHIIGHELTALYGLAHAETLAIILPGTMRVRKTDKRAKLLQYATRVWGITGKDEDQMIEEAINKTVEFFESLGLKTHLSDYDISADQIPEIAARLIKHEMTGLGENGDITIEVCEEILHKAA